MRFPWAKGLRHGTGWMRDERDTRDLPFYAAPRAEEPRLRADLSRHVPELLDQGATSSCVAHAYAYAIAIAESLAGLPYDPVSRLYLYSCARALTGDERRDEGTYLRSAARALQVMGAAPDASMPFRPRAVNDRPGIEAHMLAHPRRGGEYRRIYGTGASRLTAVRRAIEAGHQVVFGAEIAESFLAYSGGGMVDVPTGSSRMGGGHAMCLVGYEPGAVRLVNSWGEAWGDAGFAWLSDEYLGSDYCDDFWIVEGWQRIREHRALGGEVVA